MNYYVSGQRLLWLRYISDHVVVGEDGRQVFKVLKLIYDGPSFGYETEEDDEEDDKVFTFLFIGDLRKECVN